MDHDYDCIRMGGVEAKPTYHVRFLGGKGAAKPLTYPVDEISSAIKDQSIMKVGSKKIIINFILLTIVRHWRILKIWK